MDTINIWTAGALQKRGIDSSFYGQEIIQLMKIGKKLNRFYTHSCNGYNSKKYDRLAEKWEKEAETIAQSIKLHIYFQTDPRGGTIYVDNKQIPRNAYTQAVFLA